MKRPIRTCLLVAGLSLALPACAGSVIEVNGIEVYENYWEQTKSEIGPRASYETGCDEGSLKFTLFQKVARYPTEVGVEACGQRLMFIRAVGQGGIGPWVLNTTAAPE